MRALAGARHVIDNIAPNAAVQTRLASPRSRRAMESLLSDVLIAVLVTAATAD
jgi:hypothetical protein